MEQKSTIQYHIIQNSNPITWAHFNMWLAMQDDRQTAERFCKSDVITTPSLIPYIDNGYDFKTCIIADADNIIYSMQFVLHSDKINIGLLATGQPDRDYKALQKTLKEFQESDFDLKINFANPPTEKKQLKKYVSAMKKMGFSCPQERHTNPNKNDMTL